MEISIPVETVFVSSNVTDNTPLFDNTNQREYLNGETLQDNNYTYTRTGADFTPKDYTVIDEIEYEVGDIIFKDGFIQRVTSRGEVKHKKMPNDYTSTKVTLDTTESSRYVELGDITSPYATIFEKTQDGYRYSLRREESSPTDYVFDVEEVANPSNITSSNPILLTSLFDNPIESLTTCFGTVELECSFKWSPNTVIVQNGKLYTLTQTAVELEYYSTYHPTYEVVTLDTFDGWTKQYPINPYKPFDGKNYTAIETNTTVTTTCSSAEVFDTIAISGVIGDTVNVAYSGGSIDYTIDNKLDVNNRLPVARTNVILYFPTDITGQVTVTITPKNGIVRIGEILLGLSVNAGFTNLTFSNRFIDYSPTETDQWGNTLYIEGTKVNVHSGTVDILVGNYDMNLRLITSLGGSVVILNGSGSKDNLPTSDTDIFSSTMLVGRLKDFDQRTKIKNDDLDRMASYTFKIEELV